VIKAVNSLAATPNKILAESTSKPRCLPYACKGFRGACKCIVALDSNLQYVQAHMKISFTRCIPNGRAPLQFGRASNTDLSARQIERLPEGSYNPARVVGDGASRPGNP
jgi:hypothetical protein